MHYPVTKMEKIKYYRRRIDLLPTIANLRSRGSYIIGKDLLNSDKGYVVLRNGNVITDSYVYLNELGNVYSINDEKII